jgi:hypothetical protein
VTLLFDYTVTHIGWADPTYAIAGWDDWSNTQAPGLVAQSYYAEVIYGGPLDFAVRLMEKADHPSGPYWFNVTTSGPLTGAVTPYPITQNTRLFIYTRVPSSSTAFAVRVLVSDQPTTAPPSTTYCGFGTRLQPGVGGNIIMEGGIFTLIMSKLGPVGVALATVMDTFIGRTLYTNALCASPPPDMPAFTSADWLTGQPGLPMPGSLGKFWQGMQAAAWPYFCECIPNPSGGAPPIPYPDPVIDITGNPPLPPGPFVCDNMDLCAFLSLMRSQLTSIAGQIGVLRSDVSLIQRQHVPFAYVPGTLHTGLSGSGTFTVQGILGLAVDSTAKPAYLSSDMAPVASWFKLGEISWGTADGWTARRVVTHDPHLFLEIGADVTTCAYLFEPGVTANIRELIREP